MLTRGGWAALAAAAAALCACGPKEAGSDTAPASTPPAATEEAPQAKPAAPFNFSQSAPDAEVKLTLDKAIARWPALHKQLYELEVPELKKFASEAKAQRDEMKGQAYQPPPFAREVTWALSAASGRLVSLEQTWYENTGGAHPNHGYASLLWDTGTTKPVPETELFVAGDDAAIDKALCEALAAEKTKKGAGDWDRETWPCPKWREAAFVFAPSTEAGKFGGLTFLFDPYAVGPYAEGEYEVTLPWALFRSVIAAGYAGEFGAQPK